MAAVPGNFNPEEIIKQRIALLSAGLLLFNEFIL